MAKTDTFEVIEICHELGDPNELYQLNWSARDEIIVNLNRYTQLLCGEKIESETLMYENADLYQALIVLPLKSEPSSPASTGQPAAGRPSNRVVLDLDGSLRLQIVSALMTNHSLAVDGESASVEAKQKMIERNNKLIVKLVNLPINLNAGSTNGVAVKENMLQTTKRSDFASKLVKLNRLVDEKQAALIEQSNKIQGLNKEIDRLAKAAPAVKQIAADDLEQVVGMLNGKVDIGLNRKVVDFEYELQGVDAFLESNKDRRTEYFFSKHLAWQVSLKVTKEADQRYLSIYLHALSHTGRTLRQPVKVAYELSLLSQTGGKSKWFSYTSDFGTPATQSWGRAKFIDLNELKQGGYVKNDKFNVRAHLEIQDPVTIPTASVPISGAVPGR